MDFCFGLIAQQREESSIAGLVIRQGLQIIRCSYEDALSKIVSWQFTVWLPVIIAQPADIGFITNATYRPGNQHALATYALQDYEYSEKARIGSNGWITIIPTCSKSADDDTYITGWWFIKEE